MIEDKNANKTDETRLPEELVYSAEEDIYNQEERVAMDENGDLLTEEEGVVNVTQDEPIGAELDVPGAELDDENEAIGEEDEENNYYSLGGDNHD